MTQQPDDEPNNPWLQLARMRDEVTRLTRERDESREGMTYAYERFKQKLPTYDAALQEVLDSGNQSALSATLTAIDMLVADRDEARHNCAQFCGENERLKKLLGEVADVVANCCNCINLYDDRDLPHRLIDRVNAALEGRDE